MIKNGKKYLVNPAPFVAIVANPKGRRGKTKRRNPLKRGKAGVYVIRKARRNPTEQERKRFPDRYPVSAFERSSSAGKAAYEKARASGKSRAESLKLGSAAAHAEGVRLGIFDAKNPPMKKRSRKKARRSNPLKKRARRSAGGRFTSRKSTRKRNPMSKKTRRRGKSRRSKNPMTRRGGKRRSGRRSTRRMRNPIPVVRELFSSDMLSLGAGVVVGSVGTKMIMNRLVAGDPTTGARAFALPGVNYTVPAAQFYSKNAWILAFYNLAIGGGAGYLLRNQSPRLARGIMIGAVASTISDVLRNTGVISPTGTLQMPGMLAQGVGRNYGPGVGYLPGTNTTFTGPAQRFLAANNVPRPRGMGARVGPGTMAAMQGQSEGAFRGAN